LRSVKDPELAGQDCGGYEIEFEQIDGVWRIASLTLARAWAEGNLYLPRIAAERAARCAIVLPAFAPVLRSSRLTITAALAMMMALLSLDRAKSRSR
jgi:hypothetical protein